MSTQTYEYQTEVQQLLDLVVHSLYSNRDIFLRELVSNSSDAIDKLRFEGLTQSDLIPEGTEWKIKISIDKDAQTVTVTDNGIGMSKEEVIENIGTIAKSGTKAFLQQLKEQQVPDNPELIGQFGVGFYATFMVGNEVTLTTRKAGIDGPAIRWKSRGDGIYTLEEVDSDLVGTAVTVHLTEDSLDYLDDWKLRQIIKTYSDFVEHPIVMDQEKPKTDEKDDQPAEIEETVINSRKAIWTRSKSDVSEDEHKEFYRHLAHDMGEPLDTIHYHAEGSSEFKALLYIPNKLPMDIYWKDYQGGLNLYIRRVFIMHDCKKLIPEYLRFVKGVVDSNDLPLNVSREILQEDRNIETIRKSITKKVLKSLESLLKNKRDDYQKFYLEASSLLKEGLHLDFENKKAIQDLLLFESTRTTSGAMITLNEYKESMPEGQKTIYYITGDSRQELANSPLLEAFKSKGYDVLFLTDRIDEFVLPYLSEYDGVQLQSVEKGDLELDETDKTRNEEKKKEYENLLQKIQETIQSKVKDVRFSSRLTTSPSCLVLDQQGMTKQVEEMLRQMGQAVPETKRILELNPDHQILSKMQSMFALDADNPKLQDYAWLLYYQAMVAEGSKLDDPNAFTALVSGLMVGE